MCCCVMWRQEVWALCDVAWHEERRRVQLPPPHIPACPLSPPPPPHEHHPPKLCSLDHLPSGLEPSARFLDRVAVHYARNALAGRGALPGQVPLVLGIWGPKVSQAGWQAGRWHVCG